MENLRKLLLSFALGFGGTAIIIDTNPDVIQAKFGFVLAIMLVIGISLIYDRYKKSKKDLDK